MTRRSLKLSLWLVLAIALLAAVSLASGKVWIGWDDFSSRPEAAWIIWQLRLPRTLLAIAIGLVLGLAGAVLQGFLRNPLADPAIVGVSSSAALGAVGLISVGLGQSVPAIFAGAMAGAGVAMLLLALLSGRNASPVAFILAGMILSSLAGSLTAFLISIAPSPFASSEIITWLMGALTDRGYAELLMALPFMAVGAGLLALTAPALNALTLGEETARTLGVSMSRTLWLVIGGVGLSVGSSVAITGVVGFVGLIVPHLVRPFAGQRPSDILLPSALGGAALLLAADSLVRLIPTVAEVRLGVVMALLGAPFFFALLLGLRGRLSWG